ncbi:MAG TPA: 3-dehydroquinate synthase [Actinomycetota bacterium]|nr:3-dehydroquinate synthase [Actinomycetota bacterium]
MTVPVPGRPYDVTIGRGLLPTVAEHLPMLPAATTAFVVSDRGIADRYHEPLVRSLASRGLAAVSLLVPAGEEAKTLQAYESLLRQLAGREAHRDDVVIALGGGAVGDVAGFVASTYMRGIGLVQVPTTLLAQVDAAIGGKTAVNLPEGKNLVGTFAQPLAVVADIDTLATLDEREYRSGLSEVAKVALTLDPELLVFLREHAPAVAARDPGAAEHVVERCVAAKARVVGEDERDASARLVLNYGHTVGHALERLDAFRGRTHGEAVALGMMAAAALAERRGLGTELSSRTEALLRALGIEPVGPIPPADDVVRCLRLDKKYRGGVRFVLLADIGEPRVIDDVSDAEVGAVLQEMGAAA